MPQHDPIDPTPTPPIMRHLGAYSWHVFEHLERHLAARLWHIAHPGRTRRPRWPTPPIMCHLGLICSLICVIFRACGGRASGKLGAKRPQCSGGARGGIRSSFLINSYNLFITLVQFFNDFVQLSNFFPSLLLCASHTFSRLFYKLNVFIKVPPLLTFQPMRSPAPVTYAVAHAAHHYFKTHTH